MGDMPLRMPAKDNLDSVTEAGVMAGAAIPRARVPDCVNVESELTTNGSHSVLPD